MTTKVRSEHDADFYSTGGWGYDRQREKLRQFWRERYVEPFGLEPPASVLDAGCGDGFWAGFFHEAGFETSAFDISEDGICTAGDLYPGPAYAVANVELELPYEHDSFDVVFCRGITHSGRPRQPQSVAVAGRLVDHLRPGGLLILARSTNCSGVEGPSGIVPGARASNPTPDDLRVMVEPWVAIERVDVYPNEVVIGGRK